MELKQMSYARNYRKSKFNTFTKIWSLLYLIALLVFVSAMLVLDVVPSKLLLGAFVVLLIISAVFFVQLFRDYSIYIELNSNGCIYCWNCICGCYA